MLCRASVLLVVEPPLLPEDVAAQLGLVPGRQVHKLAPVGVEHLVGPGGGVRHPQHLGRQGDVAAGLGEDEGAGAPRLQGEVRAQADAGQPSGGTGASPGRWGILSITRAPTGTFTSLRRCSWLIFSMISQRTESFSVDRISGEARLQRQVSRPSTGS